MFIYATQPRSPMKIIKDAFQLFKRSFSKVWLYQLGVVLALGVIYFAKNMINKLVGFDMWVNLLIIVAIFFYLTVLIRMHRVATQDDGGPAVITRVAFRKTWPYVFLIILFWPIAALILLIPLSFAGFSGFSSSIAWCVVGALLAVLWLYSLVAFKLFAPILIVDGLPFDKTIKYSFALVRGQWWRTLWVWLLSSFILTVIAVGGGFVVGFILGFAGTFMSGAANIMTVVTKILQAAALLVLPIFAIAVQLVQLNDLKLRYAAKKGLQLNA
jgi:hypothetical protein